MTLVFGVAGAGAGGPAAVPGRSPVLTFVILGVIVVLGLSMLGVVIANNTLGGRRRKRKG